MRAHVRTRERTDEKTEQELTTINYINMTENQRNVWWDRYALRNTEGEQIEDTPEQTFSRVADAIANDDSESQDFNRILSTFSFVPGGRILSSAGAGNETMAYNCFVIPVRADSHRSSGSDSRDAIMDTINRMVQIMSRGGGVGINWSTLRPRGSHLARINGTSSGSVGWMDVASSAVGEVIQGGSRRGAAMFMLWDWHPDIEEFTNVKRDSTKITNANISVAVSDKFMAAVAADEDWDLIFPRTDDPKYNTDWDGDIDEWQRNGGDIAIYKTIKARDLWDKICAGAWDNGEPGVVFLERAQKTSTAGDIEKIICVNPCGEQPLGPYSVCNLGSMNFANYVDPVTNGLEIGRFNDDVEAAVRFLDNVIDKSYYMEDVPETRESQMKLRRIGLGGMGLADMLATLKVRYGSPEAVKWTDMVYGQLKTSALWASTRLAKEKGAAPGWNSDMLYKPFLIDIDPALRSHIKEHGLRNLFLLTQAPTGTTSLFAGVNSGIEPFFALEYERNDRLGSRMVRPEPYQKWLDAGNDPMNLPDYFVTADQLSVEEHVAMQAAAQKHIDSSISKTVNAPNSHTVEDVDKLYRLCYDSGLKGVSYFRDGCNRAVVLSRNTQEVEEEVESGNPGGSSPYIRPELVYGVTQRKRTKHGHAFVTVNFAEDNGPIEAFVNVGRASSDLSEWAEGYGRLISLALRHGIDKSEIGEQLTGVGGYSKMQPSLSNAVAEALKDATLGVVPTGATMDEPVRAHAPSAFEPDICTQCGSASFVREEGCMKCQVCGNSQC